jgi:hypothetical protein
MAGKGKTAGQTATLVAGAAEEGKCAHRGIVSAS